MLVRHIYYAGSKEEWKNIAGFNIVGVKIHYNSKGPANIALSTCTIQLDYDTCRYSGHPYEPNVVAKNDGATLTKGSDYTVYYKNNKEVGTAKVVITGQGDYVGTVNKEFTIEKSYQTLRANVSPTKIQIGGTAQVRVLAKNPVSYRSSNENIATVSDSGVVTGKSGGTVTITVTAAESKNYREVSRTVQVTVLKEENTITASNVTKVTSSKPQVFSLNATVKGDTNLTYKSNHKSVKVNKNGKVTIAKKFVGKATITITAAATGTYYEATKQVTITVNPTGTSLTSVKNSAKKTMKAAWKKNTVVTGYQVQYATASNFKGAKTVTIKKTKTTSTTIKKLKKNKKYYVRVRTYQKASGKNYYSNWSKTKTVTIKK